MSSSAKGQSTEVRATVPVTGTVTDAKGLPIPGVVVTEKETSNRVITDANGRYKIEVSSRAAVLVFSYVGFNNQEVKVGNNSSVNITLSDDVRSLNEVVVIGYGTLREKEISSTITHIGSKDLLTVGGNNALMSLQGKVAGLSIVNTATGDPNSSPSIQLRGVSSRNAGLGPLYVVDGIPGGNVDNINQNDIASIDVLKGGAASAIYGTRGSNGVILITTKKGTSEAQMNYNNYFSLDFPTNRLEALSADEFLANKKGIDKGARTNWMEEITRKYAYSQRHTVSASGGGARTNYYISGDYRNGEGVDFRSSRIEYGARINITHTPENNLYTIALNVSPRYLKSNNSDSPTGSDNGFAQALSLNPTQPVFDPTNPNLYFRVTEGLTNPYNPVEQARIVQQGTDGKYLDWNGSFKLNILKNWNTQVMVNQSNRSFFDFYFRPATHTTSIQAGPTIMGAANRRYNVNDTKNFEWTSNYSLDYKHHSLKLLGGYSYAYFNYQDLSGSNSNFPTDVYTYNNLGSGLYNVNINAQNAVGSSQNDSRLIAFFGRLNYSFNDEVFVSASLRREGSSKFGAGHKWGNFPAVSAAWDLSQRPFIKSLNWINNLKIRADYGVTGNQDFDNYRSLDTYTGAGRYLFNGILYQVYGPSQNMNNDLRWEKALNYNIGLDFSLFSNRLSGSINYYIRKNQDLLGSYDVPIPPNVQPTIYANVGSMNNSGIEFQLTGTAVKTNSFNYEISLAAATLQNKFISFSNDIFKGQPYIDAVGLPSPGSPGTIQRLQEGKRIGNFYMLKSAGYDSFGRLLVYNRAGEIIPATASTTADKQFVGNGLPKFTLSLGNTFRYKNFDVSVYLRGAFGYSIFNTIAFYIGTPAAAAGTNVLKSAYDGGKYSKLTQNSTSAYASDYFLENGNFVKIDNVGIGYTHNVKIKYLKSVRFFLTGRNLYTFTKYTGGDPESTSVNGLYPGSNGRINYYPSTLQVLGGLQASF
ncbi:SusC/RagA family TonB-linked outer membrane protein [Pedobacter chinensis]|uniref:SusC/RagA family TonB-linked outer membrane protein n=2 Tax=Pedobacter chinensis TaxID=2282421 RepID=A0A369PUD4_9SPHI|nr:SusC/RagA family TonB-linked outer membrane protein [Pedobacter chinensis]